jgi:hypothetical protein
MLKNLPYRPGRSSLYIEVLLMQISLINTPSLVGQVLTLHRIASWLTGGHIPLRELALQVGGLPVLRWVSLIASSIGINICLSRQVIALVITLLSLVIVFRHHVVVLSIVILLLGLALGLVILTPILGTRLFRAVAIIPIVIGFVVLWSIWLWLAVKRLLVLWLVRLGGLLVSLWRLVDSLWRLVDSLWRLVDSLWRLVDSLWRLVDSLWQDSIPILIYIIKWLVTISHRNGWLARRNISKGLPIFCGQVSGACVWVSWLSSEPFFRAKFLFFRIR